MDVLLHSFELIGLNRLLEQVIAWPSASLLRFRPVLFWLRVISR